MAEQKKAVIVGGHGKVALLTAPRLREAGFSVASLLRNPDHEDDVRAAGAEPEILDLETATRSELARAFAGADAVVFAAGAGGGDPERTAAVDAEAAIRSIDAAQEADVSRFVLVSYSGSPVDIFRVDEKDSFHPYAEAKHRGDRHLRDAGLPYTILGPGLLTTEPGTGRIRRIDPGAVGDVEPADTSRENVAEVITQAVAHGAAENQTVIFFDGAQPIADALRAG